MLTKKVYLFNLYPIFKGIELENIDTAETSSSKITTKTFDYVCSTTVSLFKLF